MTAKVEDENLPSKIQAMMRTNKKILDKCNKTISRLDKSQTAKKEAAEHQEKKLEKVCNSPLPHHFQAVTEG